MCERVAIYCRNHGNVVASEPAVETTVMESEGAGISRA
jgi:hypothetical protein